MNNTTIHISKWKSVHSSTYIPINNIDLDLYNSMFYSESITEFINRNKTNVLCMFELQIFSLILIESHSLPYQLGRSWPIELEKFNSGLLDYDLLSLKNVSIVSLWRCKKIGKMPGEIILKHLDLFLARFGP